MLLVLVVPGHDSWEHGRLAFERLQNRLQRRGAGAARAADEVPAHFVAFDVLRLAGADTSIWPYRRRRAALASLFAAQRLSAPWTLCPSTTDPDTVKEWLTWAAVGMEGVVFKQLDSAYQPPVRGWLTYKVRETTEAIVGAATGPLVSPRSVLLGGYDVQGRLQYAGRSTTLARSTGSAIAGHPAPAGPEHPWRGWSFFAGWGSRESLTQICSGGCAVVAPGWPVRSVFTGRGSRVGRRPRPRSGPLLSPCCVRAGV
ncbi:ATP-dependent DNA ligase [Streptomyces iakyrus]